MTRHGIGTGLIATPMLGTSNARTNGPALGLGWFIGLVVGIAGLGE